MFDYATRNKIRFPSSKGPISVEQLWDVPLRGNGDFNLNEIAKAVNKDLQAVSEESFVDETSNRAQKNVLTIKLDLVKSVISFRLNEEDVANRKAENRVKKQKLLAALAEKQEGKLSRMSEEELKRQINALSDDE